MKRLIGVGIHDRYTVNQLTGCWVYRGFVDKEGYGRLGSRMAHRAYYEALVGPVQDGFELDHLCVRRNCVNPGHLEPVTPQENQQRGVDYRPLAYQERTHCINGHDLSAVEVRLEVRTSTRGHQYEHRSCRVCERESDRRYRARKKAAKSAA